MIKKLKNNGRKILLRWGMQGFCFGMSEWHQQNVSSSWKVTDFRWRAWLICPLQCSWLFEWKTMQRECFHLPFAPEIFSLESSINIAGIWELFCMHLLLIYFPRKIKGVQFFGGQLVLRGRVRTEGGKARRGQGGSHTNIRDYISFEEKWETLVTCVRINPADLQ